MQHAFNLHPGYRSTQQRVVQHTTQGIAQCHAITLLQRLDREFAVHAVGFDYYDLRIGYLFLFLLIYFRGAESLQI